MRPRGEPAGAAGGRGPQECGGAPGAGASGGDGVRLEPEIGRSARLDAADGDHDLQRLFGGLGLTTQLEADFVGKPVFLVAVASAAGGDYVFLDVAATP